LYELLVEAIEYADSFCDSFEFLFHDISFRPALFLTINAAAPCRSLVVIFAPPLC
jgi:hypothetical protein